MISDKNIKKYAIYLLISIPLLVFFYIFVPLDFVKEIVVWVLFIILITLVAFTGAYLINRYKKEDKQKLQRLLENITTGIVGAALVTFLDKSQVYSFAIPSFSLESILPFLVGIVYVLALFLFIVAVSLLPIWFLLSYVEKD